MQVEDCVHIDRKEEAPRMHSNLELKVVSESRHKRRKSLQNTKLFVKSAGDECSKILPSVLLTFDAKFIQIGEKPRDMKERSKRVLTLHRDSDSMESSDV